MTAGLTSDVREPRHDRAILGLSDRCGCLLLVRHTTFRFCLNPTVEQHAALARHAGASRFAFNTSLRLVKHALTSKRSDPALVSWTGFDLINQFNAWKKTETAGRVVAVDGSGAAGVARTGLGWRPRYASKCSRKPRWTWAAPWRRSPPPARVSARVAEWDSQG